MFCIVIVAFNTAKFCEYALVNKWCFAYNGPKLTICAYLYCRKTNIFKDTLELACLSVCLSFCLSVHGCLCPSVYVQNTGNFVQQTHPSFPAIVFKLSKNIDYELKLCKTKFSNVYPLRSRIVSSLN